MRQKFVFVLLGIALLVGLIALPPAPVAEAGKNGQQLFFFVPAGKPKISWLYVHGTYYNNSTQTWSKTLSPAQSSYSLTNYWWKSWKGKHIEVRWRLDNGVSGSCMVEVPESMKGDWININLSRYDGRGCYASGG